MKFLDFLMRRPVNGRIEEFSKADGLQALNRAADQYLGISGEEFLRRWDCGNYRNREDEPGVRDVAFLIDFAR